jgi:hypothetical protein
LAYSKVRGGDEEGIRRRREGGGGERKLKKEGRGRSRRSKSAGVEVWRRGEGKKGGRLLLTDLRDFQHPGCCLVVLQEELMCPPTTLQHPVRRVAQHAYDQPTKTVGILAGIFREQKSVSVVNYYIDLIWLCSLLLWNRGHPRRS